MKKNKTITVIPRDCLPTRMPLMESVLVLLLLEYMQASELIRGVAWTLVVVLWLGAIYRITHEQQERLPGYGDPENQ